MSSHVLEEVLGKGNASGGDVACVGPDLALLADLMPDDATEVLSRTTGGLAGNCALCIMANAEEDPNVMMHDARLTHA